MTKVVAITSVHPVDDVRIFHKECRTLAQAGYEVILVAPHDRDEVINGIKIRSVPKARGRRQRVSQTLQDVLRAALREKADVYHFHDPELIPVGLLLKAGTGARVIYDVHEHNPDAIADRGWIPKTLRSGLGRLFDQSETTGGRAFDAIITADEDVAARFRRRHQKVTTLYNFPLKGSYADQTRARLPMTTGPLKLVYVGVMGKSRGLWLMLETMELLLGEHQLDVELELAGRIFDQGERDQFEARVAGNPLLSKRVHWSGPLPQAMVPGMLADADIGWAPLGSIPKFHKNIPTKVFEYMASWLPVVASDLPPIRRFIEPVAAGLLALPDDPVSHAERVAYLARHPAQAQRMGENGRGAFLSQYNWDSEAEKLLGLYAELTG